MNTETTKNFLLLQCCTLLLALTLLPEFDLVSMLTGIELDIPVIICKLIGVAGIGVSLLRISKNKQETSEAIPVPLFALSGGRSATLPIFTGSLFSLMDELYRTCSIIHLPFHQ